MQYRILLNTDTQIFTVISRNDDRLTGNGRTIQEAIQDLKNE
ncbi:hypothetical protein ACFQ5M_11375 [Agrilactobacillus yilanensis]|uniref:Uncharacterized protein n=1 Tax=Agrilactobacillus yilanensis TaxID=2485997 RepID=A0ABW4J9X4_9LACO|nr:hypothetical protein [Agrilactobacillus yilanensis]